LDTALGDWSGWYFGTKNLRYGPRAASFDEGSNGWKTFGDSSRLGRMAHPRMGRPNRQPRQVVFGWPGAAAKWPGTGCGFIRMQVRGTTAKPAETAFGWFRLVGWERIGSKPPGDKRIRATARTVVRCFRTPSKPGSHILRESGLDQGSFPCLRICEVTKVPPGLGTAFGRF